MLGFNYTYASQEEIFSNMTHIWNISIFELLLLIWFILFTLLLIFVIVPWIIITCRFINEQKEKRNKKKLLSQILLQKEIEDEVEKEIKIEDENEVV